MAGSKKSTTQGRKVGKEQARGAKAESERPAQDDEQDSNLQTDQPDKPVPSESEQPRRDEQSEEQPQQSTETPEKPREADKDSDDEPDTAEPSPPQPQKVPKEDDRPAEQSREARGDKGRYREAPPAPEPSGDRPTHRRDRRVPDQVAENDQMQAELAEARRVHDARTRGETVSA